MNTSTQVYELGFLLVPTLTDSEVESATKELQDVISKHKGSVTTSGEVHFIDLAYEMVKKIKSKNHKFDQAHFGWIKFTAAAGASNEIEKSLKAVDSVLRAMVVKTVENDAVTDLYVSEEVAAEAGVDVNAGVDMGDSDDADDLTKIEGIGPKIAETLATSGVKTYKALSEISSDVIQGMIKDVRGSHDSDTWPKQAAMAAIGEWDELKKWQDELTGGKE